MNPRFWKDKRVLLTGHTGFKGSWLSLWLQKAGAQVTGIALDPPSEPNLFDVADVAQGMRSMLGDIRDPEVVYRALQESRPDVVIHMAAQSLVRYSYSNPLETYETNVMGTAHVLDAIRRTGGVRSVVIVTTDKCYENKEWIWGYREGEPLGGHDPYSSSKACAEFVASSYRNSFFHPARYSEHGVGVATARAGNVIGGGDWATDRLVPDILRAIGAGEQVQIRNPDAVRPWQHVLEPLRGYLTLAEMLYSEGDKFPEAWNFGPMDSDARPVQWVVERLVKLWGKGASWRRDDRSHPHEAAYLKLDCSKARARLKWDQRLDLSQALQWIVDWHKAYADSARMREVTLGQIEEYQRMMRSNDEAD